ncbi:MAG: hemolysin family protein [Planctomycetota bacterium]
MTILDPWWPWIAIACGLLVGAISALLLALRDMGKGSLEALAQARPGTRGAAHAPRILADVQGHVAALALPRLFTMGLCVFSCIRWMAAVRENAGADWLDALLGTVIATAGLWVCAVLIPLAIAHHLPERTVFAWSGPIRATHASFGPLIRLTGFFDEVVRRLAGDAARDPADELEAELLSVVQDHEHGEALDDLERDMLEAVVHFRTTAVEQIMTPRTEITALEYTDDLRAVLAAITEAGHSRVPVYEDNLDHIRGMLYAKDLLNWITEHGGLGASDPGSGKRFVLDDVLRAAVFVPETKTVRELLAELLADRVHLAMVADEYGGTAGLVTIEDIVEEIVGEIRDEYDDEEDRAPVDALNEQRRSAELDARSELDEVNDLLEPLGVELPEDDDYDTLGGFITVTLGRIPDAGETLESGPVRITVLEAEPTRVLRVRMDVLTRDELDAQETEPAEPDA